MATIAFKLASRFAAQTQTARADGGEPCPALPQLLPIPPPRSRSDIRTLRASVSAPAPLQILQGLQNSVDVRWFPSFSALKT